MTRRYVSFVPDRWAATPQLCKPVPMPAGTGAVRWWGGAGSAVQVRCRAGRVDRRPVANLHARAGVHAAVAKGDVTCAASYVLRNDGQRHLVRAFLTVA